jgi:hypothetical protein
MVKLNINRSIPSGIVIMCMGLFFLCYSVHRYFRVKYYIDHRVFAANFWGVVALVVLSVLMLTAVLLLILIK